MPGWPWARRCCWMPHGGLAEPGAGWHFSWCWPRWQPVFWLRSGNGVTAAPPPPWPAASRFPRPATTTRSSMPCNSTRRFPTTRHGGPPSRPNSRARSSRWHGLPRSRGGACAHGPPPWPPLPWQDCFSTTPPRASSASAWPGSCSRPRKSRPSPKPASRTSSPATTPSRPARRSLSTPPSRVMFRSRHGSRCAPPTGASSVRPCSRAGMARAGKPAAAGRSPPPISSPLATPSRSSGASTSSCPPNPSAKTCAYSRPHTRACLPSPSNHRHHGRPCPLARWSISNPPLIGRCNPSPPPTRPEPRWQ